MGWLITIKANQSFFHQQILTEALQDKKTEPVLKLPTVLSGREVVSGQYLSALWGAHTALRANKGSTGALGEGRDPDSVAACTWQGEKAKFLFQV